MTKKNISIIIPALLLAVQFFVFPDSHYIDYYLNYIRTAQEPLFDWFVIMMGGISVNDISMVLIVTLLIIYCFVLTEKDKDKDRNTNIGLKHIIYGILGSALLIRIIYFCLFIVNGSTCSEYKTIKAPINEISGSKITIVVDSIPLSKSIDIEQHYVAVGDTIEIAVGKGSLGFYCLGKEYKINKSALTTTENIVDKTKEADSKAKSINSINETKPAEETKPIAEAKPADESKSNSQAKPAPKRYSKEERELNEIRVAKETKKYNAILDSIEKYKQMLDGPLSAQDMVVAKESLDKFNNQLDNVSDKQLLKRIMRKREAQKEESYDWHERNEQNSGLYWMLIILIDLCIVAGIYFLVYKYFGKFVGIKFSPVLFFIILFIITTINRKNITNRKIIKSVIIDKGFDIITKGQRKGHKEYWVRTKYREGYVSKKESEYMYENSTIGDTLEEEVLGGIFRINVANGYRIIPSNVRRDYSPTKSTTASNSPESNIAEYTNEKLFWNKIAELIEPNRKIEGTLSLLLVVDNTADKHIKKLDIYRCPKGLDKQFIYDFINKSKEVKSFTNGTYLMVVDIIKGYLQEKSLKKIETKEDFESIIFEFLYNKMPTVNGLRGSAFIDITVKADGTPEAVVTQSLNPKVDNVALEFVKSIPWEPKQNESKYRLTIMYAKGKPWQVKVWNMD